MSGAVYSINSNPSVPMGLSHSSMTVPSWLQNIVSYATISGQDESRLSFASRRAPRLDDSARLEPLHGTRACGVGPSVRPPEQNVEGPRDRCLPEGPRRPQPLHAGNSRF